MIEALFVSNSSFEWIPIIRIAIVLLITALITEKLFSKILEVLKFRRQIDKLPGPPITNHFLGNIPNSALLLFAKSNQTLAAEFYTGQIQSLLGHTIIHQNDDLFRVWLGQEPVVCIWKPEIVELVLGDNFLLEKSYHYDFLKPWLGNGLLTSPGHIWRPRRKLLVPSFHFNILQAFVPVFNRKSKLLVQKLLTKIDEQKDSDSIILDITPVITACALDAICETIMGVSINAQNKPDNDYCESVYIVGETFLERIIQPRYWLDTIFRFTQLGKLYTHHVNKLHSFTRTVIKERKQNNNSKKQNNNNCSEKIPLLTAGNSSLLEEMKVLEGSITDTKEGQPKLPKAFLDLLLDTLNLKGKQALTDEEVREEVDTFMFEGHDTTAMALSWTLFLLGHYKEAQNELFEEINNFFEDNAGDDSIQLEQIKKLKYLDCVVKEALRLCPSVPFIGRKTTSNVKLGTHDIPAGTVLFVLIYQLHRNSQIYPNPEKFDPSRFLQHNHAGRHPFAYVPFSAGPRNCIGQKFAMAEMKTVLLNLVRQFEFESVTPLDKVKVQMEMVLRPKCNLNIRIIKRTTCPSL